jgi:hypothetical protein
MIEPRQGLIARALRDASSDEVEIGGGEAAWGDAVEGQRAG